MEIFIANLDPRIEEELLAKLFEPFGPVSKTMIAKDKITGASKGFGFVTMDDDTHAQAAIDDLNGRELAGKTLNVKESRPKDSKVSWKKPNQSAERNAYSDQSFSFEYGDDFENTDSGKTSSDDDDTLIDKTEYNMEPLDDGLVKINFKK